MTIITAKEKRETLMNTVRSLNAMKNGDRRRKYFSVFTDTMRTHVPEQHQDKAEGCWIDFLTHVRLLEKKDGTCEVIA